MKLIAALLALAGTALIHAAPIAGGNCRSGTLDQYIALGDTGCFFPVDGERIYDITVTLPESADLSTFVMVFGSGGDADSNYQDAAGHFFPAGTALSLKWSAPSDREMMRVEWYQFNSEGNLTTHALPATQDGQMTMVATIPDAYLGFQLELVPLPPPPSGFDPRGIIPPDGSGFANGVPEPSAFLPLLGIGLLSMARYGVRTSYQKQVDAHV